MVLKGQYTEEATKRIALKKYFTLGGCFGTEKPVHRSRENKQENSFKKIFHFGRVFWSRKANIQDNNSFSENIALWEGVLVSKYAEQ